MFNRNDIKELILRNYDLGDVLEMYIDRLTIKEIDQMMEGEQEMLTDEALGR